MKVVQFFVSERAMEARARRAANSVGLIARKSRRRVGSIDNCGGFMIVEPSSNFPVAGFGYDLGAEAVIEYCRDD